MENYELNFLISLNVIFFKLYFYQVILKHYIFLILDVHLTWYCIQMKTDMKKT